MRITSFTTLSGITQKLAPLVPVVWYGLFLGIVVWNWPQKVLAQLSCSVTQITDSSGISFNFNPSISSDGTRTAFVSGGDIFLADNTTGTLTQLTSGAEALSASISSTGRHIAFVGSGDLTGDNPVHNVVLVLIEASGLIGQVINNPIVSSSDQPPLIAFSGGLIALVSGGDVFLDNGTDTPTQLTYGAEALSASISSQNTLIAFESSADLTGHNLDYNVEIFLLDTTHSLGLGQITSTVEGVGSFEPSINADGTRIAFTFIRDRTESNPDGSVEVFLLTLPSGSLTQITNTGYPSYSPSISGSGTRIAFVSRADLTGDNPDHNAMLFLFDTTTHAFTQITDNPIFIGWPPSLSFDGNRVAFASGGEIFLATCLPLGTDLAVTIVDSPDPVKVKTTLTYTLTVTNNGPASATGVTVTDALPNGVTFGAATPSQGSCMGGATVTCNLGNLTNGASATVTMQVTPTVIGTLMNTASVTGNELAPTASNNAATASTAVNTSGQPLHLTVAVQDQGKVTSNPPGVDCSTNCDAFFDHEVVVTLTATPATGWKFDHWERDCSGNTNPCLLTITTNNQVKTVFVKQ
jgi:uncharacterized repeat protein (TIGR01451 family)